MQQDVRHQIVAPTDPDAFLEWASTRPREEGRFELSHGQVTHLMINVTRAHARVCSNIAAELRRLLDPDRYDVATADFAVRTPFGIRGPDIVVDECSADGTELATSGPIFITEVLSRSSLATDFVEKLGEYQAIVDLQTYMIVAQDEPRLWFWTRQADRSWPVRPEMRTGRDGMIPVGGLNIELSMVAIFRGIPDAPTPG